MLSLSVRKPMGCQAYIIWFIHAFRGSTDWKEMSITFLHSFSSLKHRLMWISAEIRWVDGTPTTEPSLSGRSIHLTLVTKWSWSWSWMTYCHPLCAMSIGPPILRYSYFKIWQCKSMVRVICVVKGQGHVWPWKFKGQGYGQGQTHWSYLTSYSNQVFPFLNIYKFFIQFSRCSESGTGTTDSQTDVKNDEETHWYVAHLSCYIEMTIVPLRF